MHKLYKCKCGWIGPESEMVGDYYLENCGQDGEYEAWSNWICPRCGIWWELEDYEEVKDDNQGCRK